MKRKLTLPLGEKRPLKLFIILLLTFGMISGCTHTQSPEFTPDPSQENGIVIPGQIGTGGPVPIGGFSDSWVAADENGTFETGYIFYSGSGGPGNTTLTLNGPDSVHIYPGSFIAEPGQIYRSRVYGTLSGMKDTEHVSINVTLNNVMIPSCGDSLAIYRTPPPGQFSTTQDHIIIENFTLLMKPGTHKTINLSYQRGRYSGLGEIHYEISHTPLSVAISPSDPIVKQGFDSPSVITFNAGKNLSPGNYPVNLTIRGTSPWLFVLSPVGKAYSAPLDRPVKIFTFYVNVE